MKFMNSDKLNFEKLKIQQKMREESENRDPDGAKGSGRCSVNPRIPRAALKDEEI